MKTRFSRGVRFMEMILLAKAHVSSNERAKPLSLYFSVKMHCNIQYQFKIQVALQTYRPQCLFTSYCMIRRVHVRNNLEFKRCKTLPFPYSEISLTKTNQEFSPKYYVMFLNNKFNLL